ncbi:hypothetical protein ACMFMG_007837 [Clarireedia jacksonii]
MSAQPPSCIILGDADLYGLGVRLAVYAQALTYLCATTYSHSPRMILEIPCVLLNVSINGVLILRAFQHRLRPFDTMMALFTAGTLMVVAPVEEDALWESREKTIAGRIFMWLQSVCWALQLGFGTWAVMNDLKVDVDSNVEDCPVWIYVFSKQKNSGWAMNVWKGYYGFSVMFLSLRWIWRRKIVRDIVRIFWLWLLQLWNYVFGSNSKTPLAKQFSKPIELIKIPPIAQPPPVRYPHDPQTNQISTTPGKEQIRNLNKTPTWQLPAKPSTINSRPEISVLLSVLFWMIFFNVLGGEFMIHWNQVQGVNSLGSSGQILSLLGGTFTLAQFIWTISGL